MADMDDMYSHHFNHYRKPVDDDFKYFKYNEHTMLDKAKNYIASTYGSHYTGDKGTQTLDLIEGIGDAEAFADPMQSNISQDSARKMVRMKLTF